MELFEKELTEFDYLSEVNLYEIIEPIYINLWLFIKDYW